MEDLLALDHCKATPDTWHVPLQNGSYIVTPLGWVEWDEALNHHPDQQFRAYVVSGLRQGFRVGFDYAHSGCQRASSNMHSAREHAQVIREYLAVECSEERVVGPLKPPWSQSIQISRFGVIPKESTGKWRLILDLSSPEEPVLTPELTGNYAPLSMPQLTGQLSRLSNLVEGL